MASLLVIVGVRGRPSRPSGVGPDQEAAINTLGFAASLPATPSLDGPAALSMPEQVIPPLPNPLDWAGDRIVDGVKALLRGIVNDFVDGLVAPVARFVLHTPDLLAEPTLRRLWAVSLAVLFAVAGLLVAISATAMVTGSTRLGLAAREAVSTRLAGCLLTAAISLPLVALEVQLANRVVDAFLADGFTAASNPLWTTLGKSISGNAAGGLALLISSVVAVVLLVALVVLGLARWATLWLLVVLAPIGMGFALLPGGAGVARAWWRLQLAAVFLPIANAVLLATYVAMFSSEQSGLVGALSGIAVLALMSKLPAWAAGAAIGVDGHDVTARAHVVRSRIRRVTTVAAAGAAGGPAAAAKVAVMGGRGSKKGAPQGRRGSGQATGQDPSP